LQEPFTILIADRNPHVRKLLQREMTAEGYRVRLADNAGEVLKWAFHQEPLNMIIVDPDLPGADEKKMLRHLLDRIPALPVVVHSYPSEINNSLNNMDDIVFVQKGGSSVERLKQVIHDTRLELSIHKKKGLKCGHPADGIAEQSGTERN
jgi:DNA-binding NtrC family response regulator